MRFADCMRQNGVAEFPDANGESDQEFVDAIERANPDSAAFKKALRACKDLQPAGLLGGKATPEEMDERLAFAQCIRDNGVKDFPDPTRDGPLVDTNRIPSANASGGMDILNAAMRKCGDLAEAAMGDRWRRWVLALVAMTLTGCGTEPTPAAQEPPANTVKVERGELSAMVSVNGTLTYRARSDGSPYSVINHARGIYTKLPEEGDKVGCGDVLYRVDADPVRAAVLGGAVDAVLPCPAQRAMRSSCPDPGGSPR